MPVKNVSTAEELEATKAKNNQSRIRKLTQDRQDKNGKLAQTDGLKVIQTANNNHNLFITDDDEVVDLKRIRKLADVETQDKV